MNGFVGVNLWRSIAVRSSRKHLDLRFAVGQSMQLFVGIHEVAFSNVLFDGVNHLDLFECLGEAGGLGLKGFE
jgi:hypothetical protein